MNSLDAATGSLEKYLNSVGYTVYPQTKNDIKTLLVRHFESTTDTDLDLELSRIMDAN